MGTVPVCGTIIDVLAISLWLRLLSAILDSVTVSFALCTM